MKVQTSILKLAIDAVIRADGRSVEEMRDRLVELNVKSQEIIAKADAEGRDLTKDEVEQVEMIDEEFETLEADIGRRERVAAQAERLAKPQPRNAPPSDPKPDDEEKDRQAKAQASGQRHRRVEIIDREPGKWGFSHFGDYAQAVVKASAPNGYVDNRLVIRGAPTTSGSEGVGADGGFAVPPDFRTEIASKVMDETTLLSRTDGMTSSSNTLVLPVDENSPWDSSGLQAYWTDELAQLQQSKPNLSQNSITLHKLTVLTPVSEELLSDAPAMDRYLRTKAPERINWKIEDAIVRGNGTGKPLGLLNAPASITVADLGSGQAADSVVPQNILDMHSRMPARNRANAVWLINQDVEPALNAMQYAGSGSNPNIWPVYLPPGGLSAAPYGTLMGRPVIPSEACSVLGDVGDIIFVDLSQYLSVTKTSGPRVDISMHLYFDYDAMAFRFIFRVGGQPWWGKPWSRRDSNSPTLSAYVLLDNRTGS